MRCFNLKNIGVAGSRIGRLIKDKLVEKSGEFVENGSMKKRYRKTGLTL